jgi:hypothetical protein
MQIKIKFTHEIKITHFTFQWTIREALISINQGQINWRIVAQVLQGPCMNLQSFMIKYVYLNFMCISTQQLFMHTYLHVETINRDNLYSKHYQRVLYDPCIIQMYTIMVPILL